MSDPEPLPDHVARNRSYWDEIIAPEYVEPGRRAWATNEITWGTFNVPETELQVGSAGSEGGGDRQLR